MRTINYKGVKVYFLPELNGGGTEFGQDFIPIVKNLFGKVDHICEFASGPGFIGFSLLANNLCNRLTLIDINPKAIQCCKKTIRYNGLFGRVKTCISDGLSNVPKKERWDLIVSNPPFFNFKNHGKRKDLLGADPDFKIHKNFYKNIHKYLNKNASILFIESYDGSNPEYWKKLIPQYGLTVVKTFQYKQGPLSTFKKILKITRALTWNEIQHHFWIFRKRNMVQNVIHLSQKTNLGYFVWSKVRKDVFIKKS